MIQRFPFPKLRQQAAKARQVQVRAGGRDNFTMDSIKKH